MNYFSMQQPNSADSRKQRVVSTVNTDTITPLFKDVTDYEVTVKSEVYHTKEEFENCAHTMMSASADQFGGYNNNDVNISKHQSITRLLTGSSDTEVTVLSEASHSKNAQADIVPQSGNAKSFARSKFVKSKTARAISTSQHQVDKMGKKWSKSERKEFVKDTKRKIEKEVYGNKFRPESGIETAITSLEQFTSFARMQGLELPPNIFSKVEGIVLLCTAMAECSSYSQAFSIFLLYLKSHYSASLVELAAAAFRELFGHEDVEPQSASSKPDWLLQMREGLGDWRTLVGNPVFKKVSFLMSILVSLGLCDAAKLEWKLGSVKLFSVQSLEKHYSAVDLIDAAIETFMYFVEGGYECFVTQSFSPLMYSDHRAREFDINYVQLISSLEHVRTGNLQKLTGMDENSYSRLLESTLEEAQALVYTAHNSWEKKIFTDKMMALRRLKTQFDSIRVQGGLRVAPFTVNFYGKSSVGKSSVSAISMVTGLMSNGFAADDEMLVTLNEADKYMSNYKSFINGIFLDDVGNTKADFVEKAPTNKIIEICNNVRQYANMAEAQDKGKISIEPYMVNITTNVKDLNAHVFSEEPVSVARRAHLTVTVEVKPEFCSAGLSGSVGQQLDASKVEAFYTDEDGLVDVPMIPDLWKLTVERVVPQSHPTAKDIIAYEVIKHDGKLMKDVSIFDYLDCMVDMSRKHYAQQERLIERSSNLAARLPMCQTCNKPDAICKCAVAREDIDTQAGYLLGAALGHLINTKWTQYKRSATIAFFKEASILETIATKKLVEYTAIFENSAYFRWTNYVPSQILTHPWGRRCVEYAMRDEIAAEVTSNARALMGLGILVIVFAVCMGPVFYLPAAVIVCGLAFATSILVETVKERMYNTIQTRSDAMPYVFKKVRDNQFKYIAAAIGAFAGLYTVLKVWQGVRNASTTAQGNLHPKCSEDVQTRDNEVSPWANYEVEVTPKSLRASTVRDVSELENVVRRGTFYIRVKQGSDWRYCNAIAMTTNVILMPLHMWYDDANMGGEPNSSLEVELTLAPGTVVRTTLSYSQAIRLGDHDLTAVYTPKIGSRKDLLDFLPLAKPRDGMFRMVHRKKDGTFENYYGDTVVGLVGHKYAQFFGARYTLSSPTFSGLCMSPLLQGGGGAVIVGFHLGGKPNSSHGIAGIVLREEMQQALRELNSIPGVLLGVGEGDFKLEQYGKPVLTSSEVADQSPVNYLPEAHIRVFGSTTGRISAKSSVEPTIISDTVEEVCGVPQQWGAPQFVPTTKDGKMEPWKPWRESLVYSANPSSGVPGHLLVKAVLDYEAPLKKLITQDFIQKQVKPLTRMENVCGIDGRRFIDKMSPKTSVGFPLSGPKKQYLTVLDPSDFPDFSYPVELDEQFWSEAERMEQAYLQGERAYPVFKACLKDEPTRLDKEKVRVFQSAPIALQLLIRKYFLPIARVLSIYPLVSECAVGLNAQGPEWEQFQKHITKYGKDRILAGDYSKYDLRMPAQLTLAAFRVFIDLAKTTGNYSAEDVKIMEGIATDVCYPVMAYNGTLLQLIGSNPSGQNLTVYINSIVNSLLFRCGYYSVYPDSKVAFRDICALGTYGDDAKSSVAEGWEKFNHISFANFLAEHDMKFTMPDKESIATEYMSDADADFLKRKNVYMTEVDCHFGALDEQSIFKSLHATLHSKAVSQEEVARSNINGALREWFAHGRDIYEMRRQQMKRIADAHNLVCSETEVDFDMALQRWRNKYLDGNDQYEVQSGFEKPLVPADHSSALKRTETLRLYQIVNQLIPYKCVATDAVVCVADFGDVDMVFQTLIGKTPHFILVEVKCSKKGFAKGKKQAKKNAQAMGILNPKAAVLGVVFDPRGFTLVEEAGKAWKGSWDDLPFDQC